MSLPSSSQASSGVLTTALERLEKQIEKVEKQIDGVEKQINGTQKQIDECEKQFDTCQDPIQRTAWEKKIEHLRKTEEQLRNQLTELSKKENLLLQQQQQASLAAASSTSQAPSFNLTAASVARSIGRVLTWMVDPKGKATKTGSAAPSSSAGGIWVVSGQAVCVANPRIMLTATHVCFDGSTPHTIRVLYTPLDGTPSKSFPASLIRYSGLMDVSVLLLDTDTSPFQPANIVQANSPLFDKRGESVALACFPLVTDLNAQPHIGEKIVLNKSSALVKMPRILPGSISGTTPQTTSHKGVTRSFQLADCTYPSFAGCSGGGVFSLWLSDDAVTPQLLGVHTASIFQTGQSQLHIASLVEAEYDGVAAAMTQADNVDASQASVSKKAEVSPMESGNDGASARAAATSSSAAAAVTARSKASRKRKASPSSSPSSSVAAADVASSPGKGTATGSTTPEDSPSKKLQLKLADEVQHKSALAVCIVADTALTQHAAWQPAILAAEAAANPAAVSLAMFGAPADLDVGIARVEEEKRQQQSSPCFFAINSDQQCMYD